MDHMDVIRKLPCTFTDFTETGVKQYMYLYSHKDSKNFVQCHW